MPAKIYALTNASKFALNRSLVRQAADKGVFKNALTICLTSSEVLSAWKYAQLHTQNLMNQPGRKDYRATIDKIFCHIMAAIACGKAGIVQSLPPFDETRHDFRFGIPTIENRAACLIVGTKKGCFPIVNRAEKREVIFCTISSTSVMVDESGLCRISVYPNTNNAVEVTILGKASPETVCRYQDPEYDYEFDLTKAGFYGYAELKNVSPAYEPICPPVVSFLETEFNNLRVMLNAGVD